MVSCFFPPNSCVALLVSSLLLSFLSSGQFRTLVRIKKREIPFLGRNLVSFQTSVLGILRRPGISEKWSEDYRNVRTWGGSNQYNNTQQGFLCTCISLKNANPPVRTRTTQGMRIREIWEVLHPRGGWERKLRIRRMVAAYSHRVLGGEITRGCSTHATRQGVL